MASKIKMTRLEAELYTRTVRKPMHEKECCISYFCVCYAIKQKETLLKKSTCYVKVLSFKKKALEELNCTLEQR